MNRKLTYISLIAGIALMASCKEVDPLAGIDLGTMGVTSVTAAFTGEVYENDPEANFSAQPDAGGNIVIEIPYFYPETSDYEVPEALLTNMRVSAALATGTYIEPGLGVMDLTKVHEITAYDAAGRTVEYQLSAKITKLSGCEFTSFNVTAGGVTYQGIINPGQKTISIMVSEEELAGCTVEYAVSPHATVQGYTEGMTIKDGTKFTVVAHNEVDKGEYTILFAQPETVSYGARVGSGRNLWTKYPSSNYGLTMSGNPVRLASEGDNLYMLMDGTLHSINRKTGDYMGTVALPDGYTINSLVNDEAGNIVFAADAATDFKVYYMESIDGTPVELISYTNAVSASNIGNIRVAGDVKGNAVVTANTAGLAPTGIVWTITGGVAGSARVVTGIPGAGTLWNAYNGCFAPVSSNIADGILAFGYWTVYDLYHSSDLSSFSMVYDPDPQTGNENPNCIATASFNGARYCAIGLGSHFSYGAVPYFSVIDATSPSAMQSALLYTVPYDDLKFSGFKGAGATSDVLIVISEDGYYMDVYFVDGNYDVITCYEFDCIQQ